MGGCDNSLDLSKVCVHGENDLRNYASDQLAQLAGALAIASNGVNLKCALSQTSSEKIEERVQTCGPQITLDQRLEQPDDIHLGFTVITTSTNPDAPGKTELSYSFEWIGDDCAGVNVEIGATGRQP